VTLSSDVGWEYAAQMKAVLARSLPPGHVVDLSHELRPHAVPEAAFLLEHMARRFPPGTVHVAVVDPGVGSERAAIAIRCRDGSHLVGPDNGVLMPLAQSLGLRRSIRLSAARVVPRERPSATFAGRDLFAPAAASLALGTPVQSLGSPHRPIVLQLPRARRTPRLITGELVHIDRFGNLISNVPTGWLPARVRSVALRLSRRVPRALRRVGTYSDLEFGELGVIGSSFGLLEVSQREGSAAERIGAEVGERVELRWPVPGGRNSGRA
jgi:S-adenosyl-L-methionine hydrolase (adenosine-forming)